LHPLHQLGVAGGGTLVEQVVREHLVLAQESPVPVAQAAFM